MPIAPPEGRPYLRQQWRLAAVLATAATAEAFGSVALDNWTDPCQGPDASSTDTGEPDHSILTSLLRAHVTQGIVGGITGNLVDYEGLRHDPSNLRRYLAQAIPNEPVAARSQ